MPQTNEAFNAIPQELRDLPRWLLWKAEPNPKGGKPRKVPYQTNGKWRASTTNEATWCSYDQAVAAFNTGNFTGIGFVFNGDGLTGIDLDNCYDEDGLDLNAVALDFKGAQGYVEQSPSGNGIHIITRTDYKQSPGKNDKAGLEIYTTERYFTFTGKTLSWSSEIPSTPQDFDGLIEKYLSKDAVDFANTVPEEGSFANWKATLHGWDLDRVKAEILPNQDPSMGNGEWFKFGAALHHQGQGDPEWMDAFDEWSQGSSKYTSREEIEGMWQRYNISKFKGGVATLASYIGKKEALEQVAKDIDAMKRLDLADLENRHIEPKQFVIPNWLPRGAVTLFAGNGGIGKSYISLQAGIRMAAGLEVFGEYVPKREKVMYISAEDDESVLLYRTKAYLKSIDTHSSEIEDNLILMDWTNLINPALYLNTNKETGAFTKMFEQLTKLVVDNEITVLILDNSSILYAGQEQTRAMVQHFINGLKTMLHDLAIMLMHHVNRGTVSGSDAQTYSGSTGWHNGVRARWSLTDVAGARKLKLEKSNYGRDGFEVLVGYSSSEHVFHWSSPMDSNASAVSVTDVVLQIIQDLYVSGNYLSPHNNAPGESNAKKQISEHHNFPSNVNVKTIKDALSHLKTKGYLEVEEYDTKDRKTRSRLVVTEAGETYLTEGEQDGEE